MKDQFNIGLIVFPLKSDKYECGQFYLSQFLEILSPVSDKITVITGNYCPKDTARNVIISSVNAPNICSFNEPMFSKVYRLLLAQFTISSKLIEARKNIDIIILFFSNGFLIFPSILARLLGKKIIVATTGSFSKSTKALYKSNSGWFFYKIINLIERLNFELASIITVGSNNMINDLKINRYDEKIRSKMITSYIDDNIFTIKRNMSQRENIIGYVGRICAEKGIIELTKAIPLIVSQRNDIKFMIIGDGPLMDDVHEIIKENNCSDRVIFTGWIPYRLVPDYFNLMKFHILPSFTEALGGSNIEAMACGAISIVSNVGGLLDIVIDNKTGFVLEGNSSELIAKKINQILDCPKDELESIQIKAKEFINENFTHNKVTRNWQDILNSLS